MRDISSEVDQKRDVIGILMFSRMCCRDVAYKSVVACYGSILLLSLVEAVLNVTRGRWTIR